MRKLLLLTTLIMITLSSFAQEGTIKGRVFNMKTNEPIEFATIQIEGTTIGSTSDLDGNFIFTGIKPGFVKLIARSVGFETTVSSEIQVQGNQTTFVDIAVPEAAIVIKEVGTSKSEYKTHRKSDFGTVGWRSGDREKRRSKPRRFESTSVTSGSWCH